MIRFPNPTTNKQLTAASSRLRPTQLRTILLHPNLFKASLFTPSQEFAISFKSFFTTFSNPNRGRTAFRLRLAEKDNLIGRITTDIIFKKNSEDEFFNDRIIVALNAETRMENNAQVNIITTTDHIVDEPINTKDETHIEPIDDAPI